MYANNTSNVVNIRSGAEIQETMVILLTTGCEDGGKRATLAFAAATCAAAMDKRAIVFMVGDGAHWAYEGRTNGIQQHGFPALDELMECLIDLGGEMYICSTCDEVCSVPTDDEGEDFARHPAIEPRGMAAVLSDLACGRSVTF